MKEMVHQVWLGGEMPPEFRERTEGARRWAGVMGMEYKLWGEEELWRVFGHEPEAETLRVCLAALPTATGFSFASDFFRMRLTAEYGGLYLDTDVHCRAAAPLPQRPGVYCSVELYDARLWSTWLLWAPGEGGRAAARALWEAARRHFNRILPYGAPDIPSRIIWQVRRDVPGHGADALGLGPAVFRRALVPQLLAAGWRVEALPDSLASCRNGAAALRHGNAGSWLERGADWQARARAARAMEEAARPAWLRAQSCRALPEARCAAARGELLGRAAAGAALLAPAGTRRIVIFSNVPHFDVRAAGVRPGDHCIHINRARQFPRVADAPGVTHALVVRRGVDKVSGRTMWFDPPSTLGFLQVLHLNDGLLRRSRLWWQDYCRARPGQCPTTGFICWMLAREAAPRLPVVLAGFAPGERQGSPLWRGHAWQFEAEAYAREGALIIRPDAPPAA